MHGLCKDSTNICVFTSVVYPIIIAHDSGNRIPENW